MSHNHLKLNMSKTKILIFFPPKSAPSPVFTISVNGTSIYPVAQGKDLGAILEFSFSPTPISNKSWTDIHYVCRNTAFPTVKTWKCFTDCWVDAAAGTRPSPSQFPWPLWDNPDSPQKTTKGVMPGTAWLIQDPAPVLKSASVLIGWCLSVCTLPIINIFKFDHLYQALNTDPSLSNYHPSTSHHPISPGLLQ